LPIEVLTLLPTEFAKTKRKSSRKCVDNPKEYAHRPSRTYGVISFLLSPALLAKQMQHLRLGAPSESVRACNVLVKDGVKI